MDTCSGPALVLAKHGEHWRHLSASAEDKARYEESHTIVCLAGTRVAQLRDSLAGVVLTWVHEEQVVAYRYMYSQPVVLFMLPLELLDRCVSMGAGMTLQEWSTSHTWYGAMTRQHVCEDVFGEVEAKKVQVLMNATFSAGV
eukprot:3780661-Amphidinium_carterae.1